MGSRYPNIFSPGRIGEMVTKNRIVMSAMGTAYASIDNTASERWLKYLEARGKGEVGLIITEVTAISPEGRAISNQLGLYEDRFIPGFKELGKRLHSFGAKVVVQLHHAGLQTTPEWNGGFQPVAPSPVSSPLFHMAPREADEGKIQSIIREFADAACRAREAELDGVEIHGAHGYLVGQFLSPSTNKREDSYGGNLQGRLRFPLEIIARVREKVGNNFPVLFRISAEERIRHGLTLEESKEIALALQQAGIDALNVSVGTAASPGSPGIGSMDLAPGYLIPLAEAMKNILKIPVIGVGRIDHPQVAEKILEEGKADFVAIGRGLLADPDFVAKAMKDQADLIRRCIACNQGCIDRLLLGDSITCMVNPECGREGEFPLPRTERKKKVVVIGGGPAGMHASKIAALRGHEVTLLEKENFLGGQFLAAAAPPKKQGLKDALDNLTKEVQEAGVKIVLGEEADEGKVKNLSPEAVIVAAGSKPVMPDIKGLNHFPNAMAQDILLGKKEISVQNILVIGGGMVGMEVADFLAEKGKKVIIAELTRQLASGVSAGHGHFLRKRLLANKVEIVTKAVVEEVEEKDIILRVGDEIRKLEGIELIVLASGVRSRKEMVKHLKGKVPEIYLIGDAREVRNGLEAVLAGVEIGMKI